MRVAFACNDYRNGVFQGWCDEIRVDGIELEGPQIRIREVSPTALRVGRCEVSAEIPGQVSEREIVEANYAVIAERDELRQQLAASQAREAVLRECVEVYVDEKNWWRCSPSYDAPDNLWLQDSNGYEPAQAALAKVEGVK